MYFYVGINIKNDMYVSVRSNNNILKNLLLFLFFLFD